MAENQWALPDGFDDTVKKALSLLFKALKNAKKAIPKEALEAVRMGDWEAFQRMMDWHGVESSFDIFKTILADQAKAAAVKFYKDGGVGSKLTFDLIDERAVFFAQTRAAQLVTEITDDMRANIRNIITSATLGEKTWQQAADEIYANLPLTTRDAAAVEKYHTRQFERFMKKGMTETAARSKAARLRDAYAEKLTQSRAATIARTEIATAASEGRYLGWEAGVQSGMVDNASVKEWIAEPSACEICADMDGKTFPWDDEFPAGVMMPPAHPNCRCSAAILPPDYADSVFTNQAMIKSKVNQFEIEFAKHLAGQHNQFDHAPHRAGSKGNIDKVKTPIDRIKNFKAKTHQFALDMLNAGYNPKMTFQEFYDNPKLVSLEQARNVWIEKQWDALGYNLRDRMLGSPQSNDAPTFRAMRQVATNTIFDEMHRISAERAGLIEDVSPKSWSDAQKNLFALSGEVEPSIQVDIKKLGGILNSGEFKNQYETRRSGGTFDPSGRMAYENGQFGYDSKTEVSDRPKYGYLASQGAMSVESASNVLSYGGVRFVLKPETMERATITLGDSFRHPEFMPMKNFKIDTRGVFSPDLYGISKADTKTKRAEFLQSRTGGFLNSSEYVETQFHGKVALSDVARIEIFDHPLVYGAISQASKSKLAKLDIPVDLIPVNQDESAILNEVFGDDS